MLAEWDAAAERPTVMGAAKVPFFNRRTVAQMTGLSDPAVDLVRPVTLGTSVKGENNLARRGCWSVAEAKGRARNGSVFGLGVKLSLRPGRRIASFTLAY